MTTPDDFDRQVTRVIGWVAVMRPDLAERFTTAELRREAATILRRDEIPAAFRDAFAADR